MSILRLSPCDDVGIALETLGAGRPLGQWGGVALETIPSGHKVALRPIEAGQEVRKYGSSIGVACQRIEAGVRVFEALIATASGQPTKSEALGMGDEEFVPWHVGALL